MNDTQTKILTLLSSYGDIVELDWEFDTETIIKQLSELDNWEQGPNGKKGINLTGPVSGLGLNDKNKHSEDQEANENLLKCEDLHNFFKKWQNLARCRAVHMLSLIHI